MSNKDSIQRFIFENTHIRGEIVNLKQSFQTIIHQHDYPPSIQRILGEALAAACLLSSIIKIEGRLTVQFRGEDPLKLLVAQCSHKSEIRGLVQAKADLTEQEISDALENGTVAIIVTPDAQANSYEGIVAWHGNSFAQSIEIYFRDSEQIPTRLWLFVNETTVAGLLLQLMPGRLDDQMQNQESNDGIWEEIIYLTQTITPEELLTLDNITLLKRLYAEHEVKIFQADPVYFKCTCSEQRSANAVLMLGEQEAMQELQGRQEIVVTCEFCNKHYAFDRATVESLFKNTDGSRQLH